MNNLPIYYSHCPWCQIDISTDNQELKQHYRGHIYQDFLDGKVSKKAVSEGRQRQLKGYLESLLDKTNSVSY